MNNLVVVSSGLYVKGPLIEADIFASEADFLICKNLSENRPHIQARMLVDTGSNISGLRKEVIDSLQLPLYEEQAHLDSAGGIHKVNMYHCVLYLDIFGTKALPLDIVESQFDQVAYDGVIGRDVLQHCILVYDGPSNSYRLSAPGF